MGSYEMSGGRDLWGAVLVSKKIMKDFRFEPDAGLLAFEDRFGKCWNLTWVGALCDECVQDISGDFVSFTKYCEFTFKSKFLKEIDKFLANLRAFSNARTVFGFSSIYCCPKVQKLFLGRPILTSALTQKGTSAMSQIFTLKNSFWTNALQM